MHNIRRRKRGKGTLHRLPSRGLLPKKKRRSLLPQIERGAFLEHLGRGGGGETGVRSSRGVPPSKVLGKGKGGGGNFFRGYDERKNGLGSGRGEKAVRYQMKTGKHRPERGRDRHAGNSVA